MAHFAKIENKKVTQVIVIGNDSCNNLEFPYSESEGQKFIESIGLKGHWLQTSYNKNFRKNFAGVGFSYDQDLDAFLSPKPFLSWKLDRVSGKWISPVPRPNDNSKEYIWNEESKTWSAEPDYLVQ